MSELARALVKICGLTSVADARAAVEAGADAIGLNFVAGSPRCISESIAADIRASLPASVRAVGVFVDTPPTRIQELAARLSLHYVQLHGSEAPGAQWRLPCPVIKAFRIRSAELPAQLAEWAELAEAIMLDGAGRPGAHGGARFDWSLVDAARRISTKPLILAGGLTPENVAEAMRSTGVRKVDVASGVESAPGRKDAALMRAFVANAKAALQGVS